ncbi:MAG: exosortase system-associated protein, TIGR04073 family [Verrucomicrobia bacterium]|nr:exosortase system-associated protein, TIGR04073 family [Verrucomicrobiota bacterium]
MSNLGEFTRMGEINRSIEKSSLFDSPELGYTTGFVKGVNNSICRTLVGAFEIVTFPIPNHKFNDYGPILKPDGPRYPDSYKPGLFSDSVLSTDYQIGFSGGDIAPMVPGSKFRIFEP